MYEHGPSTKKKKFGDALEFDLKNILENDAVGQAILTIHNNTGDLTTQCQGYLCDIIVTYFLNKNITYVQKCTSFL